MKYIITQNTSNDNQISSSMQRFFHRFHISSALKMANAYKKRGTPVIQVFQYLFMLVFSGRSMYMSMLTDRHAPSFGKDTVYRFMNSLHINWNRFTTVLSSRIIHDAIVPLTDEARVNALILDDSTFERNRSAKAELLTKVYDHARRTFCYGFRMLTLGWSDGNTFLPVNSVVRGFKEPP